MESLSELSLEDKNYIMVAAIDFGTTFSGYAFSFKSSPDDIKMNKSWGQGIGFQSYKTPTSVLLDPNGQFVAFGFEAEQMYSEIIEEKKGQGEHQMYRHFKMMLHKSGVRRNSTILSLGKQSAEAMDIFAMSLKYLKDHLLNAVGKHTEKEYMINILRIARALQIGRFTSNGGTKCAPDERFIKWVITVPAIWTDEAKQFMREAAVKAGLITSYKSSKLAIALEPEAASLYCRNLDIANFVHGSDVRAISFRAGTKYLVIDAGGGTIDITAHEVLPSSQVKELHAANGGAWGGTKVDENFRNLLIKVFGKRFIDVYNKECPQQWLNLMTNFEKAKKSVKPVDPKSKIVIPLGWSMGGKYGEITGGNIEKAINDASMHGVSFSNGSFIINHEAVVALFKPVMDQIVGHIRSVMQMQLLRDCKYFLLVGGFGECEFLQNAIRDSFRRITVLEPHEAQMSVIKGAVSFGHRPSDIKSRIAKKTYGKNKTPTFVDGLHDPGHAEMYEGVKCCNNVFDYFVQKGDHIETGMVIKRELEPVTSTQTGMNIGLFYVDRKVSCDNPEYTDSPGFVNAGNIYVKMPDTTGGKNRSVDLEILFGGTYISIHGKDRLTGNEASTSIDFMAD